MNILVFYKRMYFGLGVCSGLTNVSLNDYTKTRNSKPTQSGQCV
jgi:hypothetical protein